MKASHEYYIMIIVQFFNKMSFLSVLHTKTNVLNDKESFMKNKRNNLL